MGIKMNLRDAVVICKDKEEPVKYKETGKTGQVIGSFAVGVKVYDPSYPRNARYNNFYINVPTNMVDTVKRLKLQKNSMLHLICNFDYTKEVLEKKEQQGDKNSSDYGVSRLVPGVFLKLIDIEYAGTVSMINKNKTDCHEGEKRHQEDSKVTDNKDFCAMTADGYQIENELNIPIVDLDKHDPFFNTDHNEGEAHKKIKFFSKQQA